MSKVVATYKYYDAHGVLLAEQERQEPKHFCWYRILEDGTRRMGFGEGFSQNDLPLYRLREVLNTAPFEWVYYVEGCKDADNLSALGVVATTSPEGAKPDLSKVPASRWEPLRDRHVVILPDNDDIGRKYAEAVFEKLRNIAASTRIVTLPNLPEKADCSDWIAAGGTREQLEERTGAYDVITEPEKPGEKAERERREQRLSPPPRAPIDPATVRPTSVLADELFATIKTYVALSDEAACALTLWIMHTHAFEATETFTPYIQITSPTRESGKTTLLDVLEVLVPKPLRADSASAAAIYRAVDMGRGVGEASGSPPVLLMDELDAVFGGKGAKSEKAEALRGVLNSGFKRGGAALICSGDQHEPRSFVSFCPKVLAGIGQLPDTITSRCIPIPLSRATREELEKLRPARARVLQRHEALRDELAAWAQSAIPRLQLSDEPVLGLKARHDDVWGPLLNIAHDCKGDWPRRARAAAHMLHADKGDTTDGRDPGIALLADLREIFISDSADFVPSERLAELLRLMEGRPWPEYSQGRSISPTAIAKLLRPFGIAPGKNHLNRMNPNQRGYFASECGEAFRRYLPPLPAQLGSTGGTERFPSENRSSNLSIAQRLQSGFPAGTSRPAPTVAPGIPTLPPPTNGALGAGGYPASWDA